MCGETRIPRDMCAGKHASLYIMTPGNSHPLHGGRPTKPVYKNNELPVEINNQSMKTEAGKSILLF